MKHLLPKLKNLGALTALITLLLLPGLGWGQYSGTGVFNKITSIDDLTDGYYVIVNSEDAFAMNNTHNGTYLGNTAVTPNLGTITNPATNIVWKIETNGSGRSIYNEGIAKYVSYTGSSNNVQIVDAVTTDNQRWDFTYASDVFSAANLAITGRILQYNASSPRFACYTSSQQKLLLYKMAPPSNDPAINVTPATLEGFSYIYGNGPSDEQTFMVSGSDLTDNIIITPPTNYEISTGTGGSFSATNPITLTQTDGTVEETTIYVRLNAGLAAGDYNDEVITASSTDADNQTVTCIGSVSEPPSITFYFRGPSWMNNNPHDPEIWGPFNGWASPATMTFGDVPGWWSVTVEVADASASIEYQSRFSQDGETKYQKAFENFSANPTFTTTTGEIWIDASLNESFYWQGNDFYLSQDKITETQPFDEPDNHVTEFSAAANSSTAITVTWNDSDATSYLIKGSNVSYEAITAPVDGTAEEDAALIRNVSYDNGIYQFTGLTANTTYYFKIYPYNGTGVSVNYKTDGTVPEDVATTQEAPLIIINEVDADTPGTDAAEFIELFDGGIGNTPLDGYVVVLYNGSGDQSYAAYDLDGYSTDANGYFVIGNAGVPGVSIVFAGNFLQNGADGVALYTDNASTFPNNTSVTTTNLIDAFVYDTNDDDDAGLLVLLNSGEPQVNESGRGKGDLHSSQRLPNGSGDARNTSTYDQTLPTPGAANAYADISWTGTTDTDWAVTTNWNPNYVPDIVSNAIIPDVTNDPVISATAVCKDLTIAASAIVEIAATGSLTVDGTLSNSGSLNIKSTATGTGSLINSTANVPATVERYIEAATWETAGSGWHLLSSPVAAQGISGDWTPTGTGNDYDFYAFDETATTEYWLNQKVGANNITAFIPGKGYLVAYQQTDTKTFSGNLNVADVTLSGLTNTGTSAYPGWHLAGNPFASAINWGSGTWTKTNINAVAQVWSSADGSYKTTTEQSDIIPAMNGFMVYTTGSGELTIPAGAREHNAANWYKSDEEFILLKANDMEGQTSQSSIIRFNPSATEAYDADFDAYFLAGFAPMFYSVSGSSLFALNTLPAVSNELVIPFGFVKNSATNYNIELAKNIPATIVYLSDKKTGTVTNLTDEGAYHFTAAEGDDANRFTLHFGTLGMDDPSTAAPVNIYAYGGVVYLNGLDAKASVTITDLTGRVVMAERVNGNGLSMLNAAKLPKGVYVVTAVAGSRVVSAKVIL